MSRRIVLSYSALDIVTKPFLVGTELAQIAKQATVEVLRELDKLGSLQGHIGCIELLRGGRWYQVPEALCDLNRECSVVGFTCHRRQEQDGNWVVDVSDFDPERVGTVLLESSCIIIGDTIGTGTTLCGAIGKLIELAESLNIEKMPSFLIFTFAGSWTSKFEELNTRLESMGSSLCVSYCNAVFDLDPSNGTDLRFTGDEAHWEHQAFQELLKRVPENSFKDLKCAIWDWGDRFYTPCRHLRDLDVWFSGIESPPDYIVSGIQNRLSRYNVDVEMQRVKTIAGLENMPRGLRLVRYGGGDSFRSAKDILQISCALEKVPQSIQSDICIAVDHILSDGRECLEEFVAERLPRTWNRDAAVWDVSVAISTDVFDEQNDNNSKTNLYFHGWLFEKSVENGRTGHQKYPLIGVFGNRTGIAEFIDFGMIGVVASAGINGLRPADQHIHTVDPFAGGSQENYVSLLVEMGIPHDDAVAIAAVEALGANEYYLGSDAARVNVNSQLPINQAWVACVDLEEAIPRVFVSYLILIANEELAGRVSHIIDNCDNKANRLLESLEQLNELQASIGILSDVLLEGREDVKED